MEEDVESVAHCAGVVGAFVGKALVKLLARGLTGGGGQVLAGNATVSLKRAAERLDCSQSTLRKKIAEGAIRALKMSNGRIRFEQAELIRYQEASVQEKA
jgi:excisionase family DNA binding protein